MRSDGGWRTMFPKTLQACDPSRLSRARALWSHTICFQRKQEVDMFGGVVPEVTPGRDECSQSD